MALTVSVASIVAAHAGSVLATSPPELTDSWTGVTATTITLGVANIDPDEVIALGVEWDGPGAEQLYGAWISAQNERGGVLGREIELAFAPYLPIGEAQAEAACTKLTEDDHVFAAIGILLGDTSLCFTETHETPYIGLWGQSAERDERAVAPFLAIEMADDRQRSAGVQVFLDEGLLAGKRIALYTEAQDVAVTENTITPMLDEAGIDIATSMVLDDFGDDQATTDATLDTFVERMRADDVDVVLNVSNFADLMLAFQRAGWFPEQILSTSAQPLSADYATGAGIAAESMENVLVGTIYKPAAADLLADEAFQQCVSEYNDSGLGDSIDVDGATPDSLQGIADQCASFRLFVLAAEGAGADLTPTTFGEAAEALGEFALPGSPYGSLGPGKHSFGDAAGLYDFDPDAGRMVLTGEPIVLSG